MLVRGTGADKRKALEQLMAWTDDTERDRLRLLVMDELTQRFEPPADGEEERIEKRDARSWLLATLGRVARDDQQAIALIERHLDPDYDRNAWARYWAIEGLTAGRNPQLDRIARATLDRDEDPLVSGLAQAVLASRGDGQALKALRALLDGPDPQLWVLLRALRVAFVVDKVIVDHLIEGLREPTYSDATYDTLIALGQLPANTPEAEEAAAAITAYVRRFRWPMYDSMRTNALVSLGRLRSALSVPVLLEELTDENPMIVLQAARALEAVLGTRVATRRIMEAAAPQRHAGVQSYASALRALRRAEVIDELEAAFTGGTSEQGDTALLLLRDLGGAEALDRLGALRRTTEQFAAAQSNADADLRQNLQDALSEARRGFRIVTGMDVTVFVAGLALLAIGIYLVLTGEQPAERLAGAATAAGGLFSVVLKDWLTKSRDRIEPSVRRLAGIQALFHGYLRQVRQVDQAYTQRILAGRIDPEDVRAYTAIVGEATTQALSYLSSMPSESEPAPAPAKEAAATTGTPAEVVAAAP
jgi:hypothetical protein